MLCSSWVFTNTLAVLTHLIHSSQIRALELPAMAPSAITAQSTATLTTKQLVPRNDDSTKEKTPLQAISQGVCLPGIPLFSSHDKERAWILNHMAGAFRVFARKGFTEGMSG